MKDIKNLVENNDSITICSRGRSNTTKNAIDNKEYIWIREETSGDFHIGVEQTLDGNFTAFIASGDMNNEISPRIYIDSTGKGVQNESNKPKFEHPGEASSALTMYLENTFEKVNYGYNNNSENALNPSVAISHPRAEKFGI